MNTLFVRSGRLVDWLEQFPSILAAGVQNREGGKFLFYFFYFYFYYFYLFIYFFCLLL